MAPSCFRACVEGLESRRLLAVDLLIDAAGLSATPAVTVDGLSYFFADDGAVGRELWRSDGTVAGTSLVKDLTPGPDDTTLVSIVPAGERVVFVTLADEHAAHGTTAGDYTVWASDGTGDGTVVLAQFNEAYLLTAKEVGDRVAFGAIVESAAGVVDGNLLTDLLLYFTDGTNAGTMLVRHFQADPDTPQGMLSYYVPHMHATPDRVIFTGDGLSVWSSDGTDAGTINLSPTMGITSSVMLSDSSTFRNTGDGRIVIPGQFTGKLWVTDGTIGGTVGHTYDVAGVIPPNSGVVAAGRYWFTEIGNDGTGNIMKSLWALDLETGQTELIYRTDGDASDDDIVPMPAGERLFLAHTTTESGGGGVLYEIIDGEPTEIVDLPAPGALWINRSAAVNDVLYFVVAQYDSEAGDDSGTYRLELWRSDGTTDGTGRVRTIYDGPVPPPEVALTAAAGKLAVQITHFEAVEVENGVRYDPISTGTTIYDPRELQIGRNGASARLVNGVLWIDGSLEDDDISIWRSVSNPGSLVVTYNGNERSFPFNSVEKIIVDLQAGNDRFEIIEEGAGGAVRARTSILGGDGMDTIITGAGRDTVLGGGDGDLVRTRGNRDMIIGGGGRDRIYAGKGDDQIAGGTNFDRVVSGSGVDVLFGQSAIEVAFGEDLEDDDLLEDLVLRPL